MGKQHSAILALMVISVALIGTTAAQRKKSCDVKTSPTDNKKVNVHCDCMQRLTQMSLTIDQLTINQTGCSDTGLELSWPALESMVAPEVLILAGAKVFFSQKASEEPWESSIKQIDFIDSQISEIPANAFRGMNLLEEVRLVNTDLDVIRSDAFNGLSQLKLVEIAHSAVTKIEDHAFNNLTSLEDLAIVYSTIGSIESGAITLLPEKDVSRPRCPGLGRSMEEPKEMIGEIMGRKLETIGNLSLPEFGTRLFLFKNNIITVNSNAVNSETLGFLIVGGNHFMTIESEAFNMELYNECEISAALFVGNTFETLDNQAFKGLRGKDGASYQAFIALANNTFMTVFNQSFQLSDNLVVFAVEQNLFDCRCENLGWIMSGPSSQIQRELEKEIVLKAVCLDGTSLIEFSSSCTDHGHTASPTQMETDTTPETSSVPSSVTTTAPSSSVSTFTYTTSILTITFCLLFL